MNDQDDEPGAIPEEKKEAVLEAVAAEAGGAGETKTADADQGEAAAEEASAALAEQSPDADAAAENGDADSGEVETGETGLARDIERVTALFTRSAGSVEALGGGPFRFARWSRPIAPAFFGLAEESVAVMQAGFRDAAELAGVELAGEDSEIGANILVYAVEDWRALREAPQLSDLVPDLESLIRLLSVADASQYRIFTFTPEGGLRYCVSLLRYDDALAKLSAPSLALGQAVQALLLWSDEAFVGESPVTVRRGGKALVKSRFARLLKAAYAADSPVYSEDPALAERLAESMRAARRAGDDGDREASDEGQGAEAATDGSEDVSRRRRARRRRSRAEDRSAAEDRTAPVADADTNLSADGDGADRSAEAAEPAFDPLGGDPRPPETPQDGPDDADEEERTA